MTTTKERRLRKRFSAFLITAALLFAGLFMADGNFDTYSKMLIALAGLYLGGQTATDYVKAKNGQQA